MLDPAIPNSTPVLFGKFFSLAGKKFFFKAVRQDGIQSPLDFAGKLKLYRRFEELKRANTTAIVLRETEAAEALDLAGQAGLCALVEIAVEAGELTEGRRLREVRLRIARTVDSLRDRPAILGYLIDCRIGQDALREFGIERARRRLLRILKSIKQADRRVLAALNLSPATFALGLGPEDFIYCNLTGVSPAGLAELVAGLHNVAESRPVIVEFTDGAPGQDELVACAFALGAAGVVAPPIPSPPPLSGLEIKLLRAQEVLPFVALNGSCPPPPRSTPMVSVVICAYNAERTMRPCLESLRQLEYPNYEVVIVDDGSRDATADISMDFPEFRLIRQPNKGLSAARNVGLHAAHGEIIAYTDSDCVVDPHWLAFIVRSMTENRFDGCGGPNYSPHEEGRLEACVAAAPGAPTHVLVGPEQAEHLAGCNMAFRKAALLKIDGFDPQFTSAGDDVDVCWRMLAQGFTLGFSPAAFVWHFRRNTIAAYYGQQRGYGRAEAMLYDRYPERFNPLGQIKWSGGIPGLPRTVPGGAGQVMWNARHASRAGLYRPLPTILPFLPQTFEWTLLWLVILGVTIVTGWSGLILPAIALAALALGPIWALYYAWRAPLEKCHDRLMSRLLVAFLAYTGPMRRAVTRYRTAWSQEPRLSPDSEPRQRPKINWIGRSVYLAYWNESGVVRESLIERLTRFCARAGYPSISAEGWRGHDLEARLGLWTRALFATADEEHPGGKLKNHVIARIRLSRGAMLGLLAGGGATIAAAAVGAPGLAVALSSLTGAIAVWSIGKMIDAGRLTYLAIEQCAGELNLSPLGKPTAAARHLAPAPAVQHARSQPSP